MPNSQLPARPSLEYLRKLAKDRLADLRRADPRAQLATALLAVAQDHGFSSWRALKPEIDGRHAAQDQDWFAAITHSDVVVEVSKTGNNILTQAFSDNVVLDYAGVRVSTFSQEQKRQLLDLVRLYVGNLREGHARVHMADVERRLDDTYVAWIGGTEDNSVYYYRIHSPVILIEFDHETPVGLRHLHPAGRPYREHIHSVVRTPNGNDYGKDLLRQHYQQHPH